MEVQDAEKIVLAKPVASRPSRPHFKSFSELRAGAINASPPRTFSEATLPIRPKTVRFRPSVNRASVGAVSSQVGLGYLALYHLEFLIVWFPPFLFLWNFTSGAKLFAGKRFSLVDLLACIVLFSHFFLLKKIPFP